MVSPNISSQKINESSRSATAPKLVSVVIPLRNGADTLEFQLQALASQTYPGAWEVVIADNGSTDDGVERAQRWRQKLPELRVIDASNRRGINHARNAGAAAARGDLLLFCDADDVAAPGWVEAMARASESSDLVGGPGDRETLNDPVTVSWRFPHSDAELPTALRFLPYAEGFNLGIKADAFKNLGGWNEGYAGGCDEIELCWRAQLDSYRIGFAPDAVMKYRLRHDLSSFARQIHGYGRSEPRLYKDFRDHGVPRTSVRKALWWWAWIVWHTPDLFRSPKLKGRWVRWAAYRSGRLRGSIRNRVLFL
jgi:glycosyltransferase involved in cell wall biosynthesis